MRERVELIEWTMLRWIATIIVWCIKIDQTQHGIGQAVIKSLYGYIKKIKKE